MVKNFFEHKKLNLGIFAMAGFFVFLASAHLVSAAGTDDFVITVKTDNAGSSSDIQFTIPT